jgi:hypothetical protein
MGWACRKRREISNSYRILVRKQKPLGKRSLGRLRKRWENNIKMALEDRITEGEVDRTASESCPMTGFGIGCVEVLGSATTELVSFHLYFQS